MITKARFLKYFKKEEKKETINVGGETREVLSSVTFSPTMYSVVFPNRSYKTMLTDLATETPPNEEGNYMIEDTIKKLSNTTLIHYNNIRKKEMADIEDLMDICKDFKLTGSTTQYFARNGKLSDLVITPNDEFVKWYSDPEATTEITTDIDLVHGTTYYAVRDNGTCKATLNIVANDRCFDFPTAPTGDATQTFDNSGTIANLIIANNAYAKWFSDSGLTDEIETSTPLEDGATYYVANQNEYCVSGSLAITTNDRCLTIAAPTGDATQAFTPGQKLSDLVVSVPSGGTLQWYSDADLNNTLPNTTDLVHEATYYAATIDGACKRGGFEVSVTNICHDFNLEVVEGIGTYSKKFGETIQLSSFNDKLTPATNIEWSINNFSGTVPATTSVVHGTTYYVRRNNGTCVSEIFSFVANDLCNSHPELPVGDRIYNYENVATVASMQDVFDTLSNPSYLKWYDNVALTGSALEPSDAVVSGNEYYAVYENNACVSNVVKVEAKNTCLTLIPPTGDSPQTFEEVENPTIADIVVESEENLKWYSTDEEPLGTALPTSTPLVNGTTYYVRAESGTACRTEFLPITVVITPAPEPDPNPEE